MAVLITRPEPHGQQLCQQLSHHGIDAVYQPLLQVVPGQDIDHLPQSLQQADIIIAVSQPAVQLASRTFQEQNLCWPSNALYIAVGQKTAHVLSKETQQNVNYPSIGDSEHLLKLPELQSVSDKTIVILRGDGGRELIYQQLVQMGAKVEYREVYKRDYIPLHPTSLMTLWKQHGVDSLVVTSSGQLSHLISQFNSQDTAWLSSLRLFVPSQRILEDAQAIGFKNITNTGSASNDDLLAALLPA